MKVLETTEVLPAPFMSEEAIRARVEERRREIIASGGIIVSERRIRNIAFDRRGERTTTQIVVDWTKA